MTQAVSQKAVDECRGVLAEELKKIRAEMASEDSRHREEAATLRSELVAMAPGPLGCGAVG